MRPSLENSIPETQTSPALTGGIPPIPPHNGPPTLTAIGTPDFPEGDLNGDPVATLKQLGYNVTRLPIRPRERHQPVTERVRSTIAGVWNDTLAEVQEVLELLGSVRVG